MMDFFTGIYRVYGLGMLLLFTVPGAIVAASWVVAAFSMLRGMPVPAALGWIGVVSALLSTPTCIFLSHLSAGWAIFLPGGGMAVSAIAGRLPAGKVSIGLPTMLFLLPTMFLAFLSGPFEYLAHKIVLEAHIGIKLPPCQEASQEDLERRGPEFLAAMREGVQAQRIGAIEYLRRCERLPPGLISELRSNAADIEGVDKILTRFPP